MKKEKRKVIKLDDFSHMRGMCSNKFMEVLKQVNTYSSDPYHKQVYNFFDYNFNIIGGLDEKYLEDRFNLFRRQKMLGAGAYSRNEDQWYIPNYYIPEPFYIKTAYSLLDSDELKSISESGFPNNKFNLRKITKTIRYNFIDVSDDGKYITYIPFDNKDPHPWIVGDSSDIIQYEDDGHITHQKRFVNVQKMKVGKFFKSLFEEFENGTIENLTSLFKSLVLGNHFFFTELKGNDILSGFDTTNLKISSTLNKSCMNNRPIQYFDIYTKNEKQVSLLVLKNKFDGQILGRALLWKCDNDITYMDRVYYSDEHIRKKFINYSLDNNYYSYFNNHKALTLELNESDFNYYPYLDSFKYLNIFKNKLFTEYSELMSSEEEVKYKRFKFLIRIFKRKKYRDYKSKINKTQLCKLTSTSGSTTKLN